MVLEDGPAAADDDRQPGTAMTEVDGTANTAGAPAAEAAAPASAAQGTVPATLAARLVSSSQAMLPPHCPVLIMMEARAITLLTAARCACSAVHADEVPVPCRGTLSWAIRHRRRQGRRRGARAALRAKRPGAPRRRCLRKWLRRPPPSPHPGGRSCAARQTRVLIRTPAVEAQDLNQRRQLHND